jgi:hypothetical protein
MPKQLDCTIRIESTENNEIYGIHFDPHMTFSRLSRLAIKGKPGLIDISGLAWTALKANHYVQQMTYKSSSLNSISGLAMILELKITPISLEHYTSRIFSNVSNSFWHISHFRDSLVLNWCASLTLWDIESTARSTRAIGGAIHRINFLLER